MLVEDNRSKLELFEHIDKRENNHIMNIFVYRPKDFHGREPIVVFSMSGCMRNADDYCRNWIDVANENDYIVLAPEFDKQAYSIPEHEYGGVIAHVDEDYTSQDPWTPYMSYSWDLTDESTWIYANIDEIFEELSDDLEYDVSRGYVMYGHSSGSQFTHRHLMLANSKFAKQHICANSGQWTCYDEDVIYPNGIANLEAYRERLEEALTQPCIVLSGEEDTKPRLVNCMPADMAQGSNRVERAHTFFNSAEKYAKDHAIPFNWKFVSVPGVGHSGKLMVPAAVNEIEKFWR